MLHRFVQTDTLFEVTQVVFPLLVATVALECTVLGLGFVGLGGLEFDGIVLEEVLGEYYAVWVSTDPGSLRFVLDVGGLS